MFSIKRDFLENLYFQQQISTTQILCVGALKETDGLFTLFTVGDRRFGGYLDAGESRNKQQLNIGTVIYL